MPGRLLLLAVYIWQRFFIKIGNEYMRGKESNIEKIRLIQSYIKNIRNIY